MLFSSMAMAADEFNTANTPAWDDPFKSFPTNSNFTQTSTITWLPVENVSQYCNSEQKRRYGRDFGYSVNACGFWDKTPTGFTCTVITKKSPTMQTLGHEVRHCFQGAWH